MFTTIWNFIGSHIEGVIGAGIGGVAWHGVLLAWGKVKPLFSAVEADIVDIKKKL